MHVFGQKLYINNIIIIIDSKLNTSKIDELVKEKGC